MPTEGVLHRMKARGQACNFFLGGRCAIYNVRPVDCRLFPFDIHLDAEGSPIWVLHHSACPIPVDPKPYFNEVVNLVEELKPCLVEFATIEAPRNDRHPTLILDRVDIPVTKGICPRQKHPGNGAGRGR